MLVSVVSCCGWLTSFFPYLSSTPCLPLLAFSCSLDILLDPPPFPLSISPPCSLIALIPHFLPLQNVDVLTPRDWFTKSIYLPPAPTLLSPLKGHLQTQAPLPSHTCHPSCCRIPSSPPFQREHCP